MVLARYVMYRIQSIHSLNQTVVTQNKNKSVRLTSILEMKIMSLESLSNLKSYLSFFHPITMCILNTSATD